MELKGLTSNPDYLALPETERATVVEHFAKKNKDFQGLPEQEKIKVLNHFVSFGRKEPVKQAPTPEKAGTFKEELGQAVSPEFTQIGKDIEKIKTVVKPEKTKILSGDQLREQFHKDWNVGTNEVAAFISAPIAAIGGALASLTKGANVPEAQATMQKTADMLTVFHPKSEALSTAFSLVGQGINVLGADVGVVSAEFKRLFNKDMSHDEYQEIVNNSKHLTNVTAALGPMAKATYSRTAPLVKTAITNSVNKAKGSKEVTTPEEQAPEIKIKTAEQKRKEVQPEGQQELPFSTSIEEVAKHRAEKDKIQQDLFSEENIQREEAFRSKTRAEEDAWDAYKKEKEKHQKEEYAQAKRDFKLESYEDILEPKARAGTTPKQQGPKTRAEKAKITKLYTFDPSDVFRKFPIGSYVIDKEGRKGRVISSKQYPVPDYTAWEEARGKLHDQAFQGYKSGQHTFEQARKIFESLEEKNQERLHTLWKNAPKKGIGEAPRVLFEGEEKPRLVYHSDIREHFTGPRSTKDTDFLYTANPIKGIQDGLALLFGKSEAHLKSEDLFYTLSQNRRDAIADETVVNQTLKNYKEAGLTKEQAEKFPHYYEGGEVNMTPKDVEMYNQTFVPLMKELGEVIGRVDKLEGKNTISDKIFPRYALEKGGIIDRIVGISREGIPEHLRSPKGKPTIRRGRTFFSLEHPDKSRQVVSIKDGKLYSWEDGKATPVGKSEFSDLGKYLGETLDGGGLDGAKITHATLDEVSKHTDTKYFKDGVETLLRKAQELKAYERTLRTFDTLKNSPEWSKVAIKEDDVPPGMEGQVRPFKYSAYFPQLRGYMFDPRVAETLEDFLKPGIEGITPKIFEAAQNYILKAMFLWPMAHMNNEAMHWIPERGFEWMNPAGYKRMSSTGKQAVNSVLHQDPLQVELLRNGAPLLYPAIKNSHIHKARMDEALKEASTDPKFIQLAKDIGMKTIDLVNLISSKSNSAMWAARDMMLTQLVLEHMEREKPGAMQMKPEERAPIMQKAIKDVGKHMPTYEFGSRVLGSRTLARIMKNPALTVFSYYHYGVVKSFGEFAKSLVLDPIQGKGDTKKLAKDAFNATGQVLAVAFVWSQLYPWMDQGASTVLGDDVKFRRAGGFKLIQDIKDLAIEEKKDPETIFRSLVTPAPMLQIPIEMASNLTLPYGKPIHLKEDPLGRQVKDVLKYGYTRMQLGQISGEVYEEKKTLGQAAKEYFLDVKVQDKEKQERASLMRAKGYLKVLKQRVAKGEQLTDEEWKAFQFLADRIGKE